MKTEVKVIIITSSIVALGSILFFTRKIWMKNGDSDNNEKDNTGDDKGDNDNGNSGTGNSGNNGGSTSNYPFSNTTQGNAFRSWVNTKYPAYAKSIQLDPTGSYNNSFIAKAYAKYGSEYSASSSSGTNVGNTSTTNGNGVYARGAGVSIYLATANTNNSESVANPIIAGSLIRKTARVNEYLGTFARNFDIYGSTYIGFKDVNSGRNVLILKSGASVK